MKKSINVIKNIDLSHIMLSIGTIIGSYGLVFLAIGCIQSLDSYILGLLLTALNIVILAEVLRMIVDDIKLSSELKRLNSIDGLNVIQRSLIQKSN